MLILRFTESVFIYGLNLFPIMGSSINRFVYPESLTTCYVEARFMAFWADFSLITRESLDILKEHREGGNG